MKKIAELNIIIWLILMIISGIFGGEYTATYLIIANMWLVGLFITMEIKRK